MLNTCLNWLTGKVHFLDFIEYSELIVEVMGYYARGYGLWKRKENTRRTHTSQFTIACNLSNCLERVSRND